MYCIIICIFALCIFIHWYALSSVCLYVYVSVCLYVYVCLSQYLPPYMHAPNSFNNLNRSNPLSFFLSLSLSFSLPISLFVSFFLSLLSHIRVSLFVFVSLRPSVSPSVLLYLSFSLCPPLTVPQSLCPSVSVSLFVCLSVSVCVVSVCFSIWLLFTITVNKRINEHPICLLLTDDQLLVITSIRLLSRSPGVLFMTR